MRRIGFLLLPQLPLIPFAAGIEVLRLSNRQLACQFYSWYLLSNDGEPVDTSAGITMISSFLSLVHTSSDSSRFQTSI